jgi:ABC-type sugar transport system substrate-binding protein
VARGIRSNIGRIAAILGAFDATNAPVSTSLLIERTGLSRPTAFGLLRALVREGWVERVDHGLIRLGPRAATLANGPLEPGTAFAAVAPVAVTATQNRTAAHADEHTGGEVTRPEVLELVDTRPYMRTGMVRIGFSNASLSNPWRHALMASMQYARHLAADRIADLVVENAEDDPARQLSQINALVEEGVDLLIVSCTTVHSQVVSDRLTALAADGLPILAVDRRPSDAGSLVSFVTASDTRIGQITARWLAERLGKTGRIWMLSGTEGASPSIRRQGAALAVFGGYPGIQIEAVSHTGWTEAGGYAAIDGLLAQGLPPPDGVWCDSGLQGVGSLRRFVDAKLGVPVHTGGDLNRMYKQALHLKLPFVAVDYPAAMGARVLETALEVLAGKPVRRRIEVAAPIVMPRGQETASVGADVWAEAHVRWDLPDDAILSQGPSLRARGLVA